MSYDLKKIVGRVRRTFYIVHKGELSGKCLAIAIIINELCKIHNVKCEIIKKYISKDRKTFYQHYMVRDDKVVYDTTLIPPEYIFDSFEGENYLTESQKEYESKIFQQYLKYLNNSTLDVINKIINFYLPKVNLD